jgi:hypothetical protein
MPEPRDTHHPNRAPTLGPAIQRLGALVGRWRTEGHIVGEVAVPITGTDVYEWLAGGFFLVHHVDVVIGDQQVQALELLGLYDPATDAFTARAHDNLGSVTVMQARVDEQGVWRFTGGPSQPHGAGDLGGNRTASPAQESRARPNNLVNAAVSTRQDRRETQIGVSRV